MIEANPPTDVLGGFVVYAQLKTSSSARGKQEVD
jgi:hypothetical protein